MEINSRWYLCIWLELSYKKLKTSLALNTNTAEGGSALSQSARSLPAPLQSGELDNTTGVKLTSSINLWLLQIAHLPRNVLNWFRSTLIIRFCALASLLILWLWSRGRNVLKWNENLRIFLSATDEPFKLKLITIASLADFSFHPKMVRTSSYCRSVSILGRLTEGISENDGNGHQTSWFNIPKFYKSLSPWNPLKPSNELRVFIRQIAVSLNLIDVAASTFAPADEWFASSSLFREHCEPLVAFSAENMTTASQNASFFP